MGWQSVEMVVLETRGCSVDPNSAVTLSEFRVLPGTDKSICYLNQKWLEESSRTRDTSRFDFAAALVVTRAASCPGTEILGRREHADISPPISPSTALVIPLYSPANYLHGFCSMPILQNHLTT